MSLTLQCSKKVDIKTLKCIPTLMIGMHLGGSYRPEILYVSQATAWGLIFNPNIQVYRAYLAPSMINPTHSCSLTPNEFALIPVWHNLVFPPLDCSSRKHVSMHFMRRLKLFNCEAVKLRVKMIFFVPIFLDTPKTVALRRPLHPPILWLSCI